jgi:lipid-binding SYLF domain-containing protein
MLSACKIVVATTLASTLIAAPALAQNTQSTNNRDQTSSAQRIVDDASSVLAKLKTSNEFQKLLKQAKGIYLIPNLVKGAAIVGGSGGTGVLLVRHGAMWSDPAFLTLGSISIGAQVGGEAGPVALLLMTDKAVNAFTQQNNFALNGQAGLTIVNYSAKPQGSVGYGDVMVWSGQSGALAGVNITGSDVVADNSDDQNFYSQKIGTKEIIGGQVTTQKADKLRSELAS